MGTVTQFAGYCIFAASMLFSGGTIAAQFTPAPRDGCFAGLSGQIVEGDAANFRAVINRHWTGDYKAATEDNADQALCLDSPGGSFLEAMAIATAVHEEGIATRIGAGDECLSACALVFMAGRVNGAEGDGVRRILDVEGTLGFHAPYLLLDPESQVSGRTVNDYVPKHNRILSDFIRFASFRAFSSYKPSFSMGLFTEMLATPPDELFVIDTVERAARWSIQLDGLKEAVVLTESDRVQACENELAWLYDEKSTPVQDPNASHYMKEFHEVEKYREMVLFEEIAIADMSLKICHIETTIEPSNYFSYCLHDEYTGVYIGNCTQDRIGDMDFFPWWHAMPPDMPLRELR